ncbi:hypothetical protein GGI04_001894 [Coemansia thaxteri]|uniref:Uncharacterized protein n=1 Tax=Coemansia thaxteri TaxID=2663907 RepID=A0A9W8EDA8_9FUNG|nr:hypothetical protein H4R26_004750 [Coemansia thaxteri]KAJ2006409.1 hypothetical protein GGI04_001894 [Coemansia thaxteri]KAJ2471119.1 hypothetical protein GGI02_002484 [Coemansia sp. RSA 2322]KAJ2486004.1 hypothetical protein EV174_001379 [Coemansia sp. RSA 2320]
MEYVLQQLSDIIKDVGRASRPSTSQAGGAIGAAEHVEVALADLYVLLGHEHALSALKLVDRGVVCLSSSSRSLFKVKREALDDDNNDDCYCLLPGLFCSACTRQGAVAAEASSDCRQQTVAAPCIHTTATLLAVAQHRHASKALSPQELAAKLFAMT